MKQRSVALVVLVDPNCGTCTEARDTLRALRDRVERSHMAYYVVMLPETTDTQKYFAFADSLKLDAEAFVWSNADSKAPTSLASMTKPSHLQITMEGLASLKARVFHKTITTDALLTPRAF